MANLINLTFPDENSFIGTVPTSASSGTYIETTNASSETTSGSFLLLEEPIIFPKSIFNITPTSGYHNQNTVVNMEVTKELFTQEGSDVSSSEWLNNVSQVSTPYGKGVSKTVGDASGVILPDVNEAGDFFAAAFWYKTPSVISTGTMYQAEVFSFHDSVNDKLFHCWFDNSIGSAIPGYHLRATVFDTGYSYKKGTCSETTFDNPNEWNHIAFYCDLNEVGGRITIFINGVQEDDLTVDPQYRQNDAVSVLGPYPDNSLLGRAANGAIVSNFKTQGEISKVYWSTDLEFKNEIGFFKDTEDLTASGIFYRPAWEGRELFSQSLPDIPAPYTGNSLGWNDNYSQIDAKIGEGFMSHGTAGLTANDRSPDLSGKTFYGVSIWYRYHLYQYGSTQLTRIAENDQVIFENVRDVTIAETNVLETALSAVIEDGLYIKTLAVADTSGSYDYNIRKETKVPLPQDDEWHNLFFYVDGLASGNPIKVFIDGVEPTPTIVKDDTLDALIQQNYKINIGGRHSGYGYSGPTPVSPSFGGGCTIYGELCDCYWSTDPAFKDNIQYYATLPTVEIN
jgi:hypothetical protein